MEVLAKHIEQLPSSSRLPILACCSLPVLHGGASKGLVQLGAAMYPMQKRHKGC